MKEFKVTDGKKNFILNLPTNLNEITSDYLKAVTENVDIAPYHAIIASVYRCKLPEIISSNKKSRAMAIAIVPVFVKANTPLETEKPSYDFLVGIEAGDKIVIAGSDIERGYQISTPRNLITIDNIIRIYNNDNNFAKEVMIDQNYYFFVDFKLVPINDIKGRYINSQSTEFINPFVSVVNTEAGN